MKKSICILGSTGSIGKNSLSVINSKKKLFSIKTLVADTNYKEIIKQIKIYKPKEFVVNNNKIFLKVKLKYKNKNIKIYNNYNHFNKIKKKIDITISAIPGIAGLEPTMILTKVTKKILIANKEAIICGWDLINGIAKKNKTQVVPIDSEHYSIFELTKNYTNKDIDEIHLTASGGPFLDLPIKKFKTIRPQDAVKHPKWKMGKKISVDSSTLMNKVLEIIEANKIFSFDSSKYKIIVHPQSLVHAIIKFKNGLSKMIYHHPDMKITLANAIFNGNFNLLDLNSSFKKYKTYNYESLVFLKVNVKKFPIVKLLPKILKYPSASIILNGSNEILVDRFLKKEITFNSIVVYLSSVLSNKDFKKYASIKPTKLKQIYEINNWSKKLTNNYINKNA